MLLEEAEASSNPKALHMSMFLQSDVKGEMVEWKVTEVCFGTGESGAAEEVHESLRREDLKGTRKKV